MKILVFWIIVIERESRTNQLMDFYLKNSTLRVVDEETIMELFKYFINRDMILAASLMQLATIDQEHEQTLLQIEGEEKHN